MGVVARREIGSSARRLVAMALLCALAACGGGGSSDSQSQAPLTPPPTTGTVSIPAGSEILALGVGSADQIIYVMPGESTAHRVELLNDDATARYDVTVTDGNVIARAVEVEGRWAVVVDSHALAAGTAHAYRLQVRNRTTAVTAEIYGPIKVLPPTVVGTGQISAAGGTVVIAGGLGQVVFEPRAGAQTLGVTVLTADSPGGRLLRVRFDNDVAADDRGVSIRLPADGLSAAAVGTQAAPDTSQRKTRLDLSPDFAELSSRIGVFTSHGGFRLDNIPTALGVYSRVSCGRSEAQLQPSQLCVTHQTAVRLSVRRPPTEASPQVVEPVLFVHGYAVAPNGPRLGGGTDTIYGTTWDAFPRLTAGLSNLETGNRVQSYEFQWATNAKFEQVADDLARAISKISEDAPGQKMTIVAHSFGGVLVRTMLQGLGTNDFASALQVAGKIRQVVTLGAPHSGIATSNKFMVNDVSLPEGGEGSFIDLCHQIPCYQMGLGRSRLGVPTLFADETQMVGVSPVAGLLAAKLSTDNLSRLDGMPFAVGIGLGLQLNVAASLVSVTSGDGLISFDGQRFKPHLRFNRNDGTADAYLDCNAAAGAHVREEVLVDASRLPFQPTAGTEKGLVHTSLQRANLLTTSPVNLEEAAVSTTDHPSFKFVKQAIEIGVCPTAPQINSEPQSVSVQRGQSATFNVAAGGSPLLRYQWFRDTVAIPNATAPTFTVASVPDADNGARFWVVVSNSVGSQTSASALLTVTTAAPGPPPAQRISTGVYSTCAITPAGGVKCWGAGPLGDGTTDSSRTPVDVLGLGPGVVAVSVGAGLCALTDIGGVKCWGTSISGDGSSEMRLAPVDVVGLTSGAKAIAAGSEHMCAVTAGGGVQCWGVIVHRPSPVISYSPVDVPGLSSGVVAIAAGLEHTCALTTAGGVKCWGSNLVGQLGDGTTEQRLSPVDVVGLDSGVVAITAGVIHTCAITRAGAAVCWGTATGGRLGDGTTQNIWRLEPVGVSGLTSGVVAISAGPEHTCALVYGGAVKCWGSNYKGALGDGTSETRSTPVDVVGLSSGVAAIDAGAYRTCALMQAGRAKCGGWNVAGALGDGTDVDRSVLVDVIDY